jgi:hypothetical protein
MIGCNGLPDMSAKRSGHHAALSRDSGGASPSLLLKSPSKLLSLDQGMRRGSNALTMWVWNQVLARVGRSDRSNHARYNPGPAEARPAAECCPRTMRETTVRRGPRLSLEIPRKRRAGYVRKQSIVWKAAKIILGLGFIMLPVSNFTPGGS